MNNVDDKIGQALDVEVIEPEKTTTEVVKQADADNVFERDFEYTRENIMQIIETGNKSLEELFELARQAQNARAFEVIAGMIKTLADANKDLMELHKKKVALDPESHKPQTVNQNLYVGSTAELMKMIKNVGKSETD